jgi:hypothetical protein
MNSSKKCTATLSALAGVCAGAKVLAIPVNYTEPRI